VAGVANADHDAGLGGAGFDDVAAGATNFRLHIFRMYFRFHKARSAQGNSVRPINKRYFSPSMTAYG
jgi:hypothetical protein